MRCLFVNQTAEPSPCPENICGGADRQGDGSRSDHFGQRKKKHGRCQTENRPRCLSAVIYIEPFRVLCYPIIKGGEMMSEKQERQITFTVTEEYIARYLAACDTVGIHGVGSLINLNIAKD